LDEEVLERFLELSPENQCAMCFTFMVSAANEDTNSEKNSLLKTWLDRMDYLDGSAGKALPEVLLRAHLGRGLICSSSWPACHPECLAQSYTCLCEPRPSHTYFQDGDDTSFTLGKQAMKRGSNGGLVLFKADYDVYQAMWEEMKWWKPASTMAEQEFGSCFWAGQWNGIHKKNYSRFTGCTSRSRTRHVGRARKAPSVTWWTTQRRSECSTTAQT